MLKLITAQQWVRETFPEGGVGVRTVEQWILSGTIHGRVIGGKVFVDADRTALLLDGNTVISPYQAEKRTSNSGDLVSRIVQGARNGTKVAQT